MSFPSVGGGSHPHTIRLNDTHGRDICSVLFAWANTEVAAFSTRGGLCRDMLRKLPPRICQTSMEMLTKSELTDRHGSSPLAWEAEVEGSSLHMKVEASLAYVTPSQTK